LDPITRAQLQEGDWNVKHGGSLFDRNWFQIVDAAPPSIRSVRYWDFAATEPKPGKDPDFTCGLKMSLGTDNFFYIEHVDKFQKTPGEVERRVRQDAEFDGFGTQIYLEEEPCSSGKNNTYNYVTKVLLGYPAWGNRETGSKFLRAQGISAAAERGIIKIVRGTWNLEFLDELEAFPNVSHDDQVDALSGAFRMITNKSNFLAIPIEVTSVNGSYWRNRDIINRVG
jgi:predicted phage terminase large subunit-like protein